MNKISIPLARIKSAGRIPRILSISLKLIALVTAAGLLALPLYNERTHASGSGAFQPGTPPVPTEFMIPTANSRSFQTIGGPDGNFWFCETQTAKIGRVTTSGVFTEFPLASGSIPYAIATGPDNN